MNSRLLSFGIALLFLFQCPTNAREWTNQKGKTVEGDFVKLEGSKITLKIKGKNHTLPLADLSQEDQAFAKQAHESAKLASSGKLFAGNTVQLGQINTFTLELSEENREITEKGGKGWRNSWAKSYSLPWIREIAEQIPLTHVSAHVGLPRDFDPKKPTPIFFQWSTGDAKNNLAGARAYWSTCNSKGWILLSVDAHPKPADGWTNSNFLAGAKEVIEQVHKAWPATKTSPIVAGGFSGGAKISQWMGPLMAKLPDTRVTGLWLGGCNEGLFEYAMEDLRVSKRDLREIKVYISTGEQDSLVPFKSRKKVEKACKAARLKEVRSETYKGGHSIHLEHFAEALDWFLQ